MLAALDITTPITIGLAATLTIGGYILGRFVHRFEQIETWQRRTVELLDALVTEHQTHQTRIEKIEERVGL